VYASLGSEIKKNQGMTNLNLLKRKEQPVNHRIGNTGLPWSKIRTEDSHFVHKYKQ